MNENSTTAESNCSSSAPFQLLYENSELLFENTETVYEKSSITILQYFPHIEFHYSYIEVEMV